MKKSRPGVFDPWRQDAPEEAAPAEPQKALRIADALELNEEAEQHCVMFNGRQAGLNVWFNGQPKNPNAEALKILVDLVISLYGNFALIFTHFGVELVPKGTSVQQAHDVVLTGGERRVYIHTDLVGGDTQQAVDTLALVLRELQDNKAADAKIRAARVKPFLK